MERIYEPEYIKILRKSQFRNNKCQLSKFYKNQNLTQGITNIAFEKIDKTFNAINNFIDKLYIKVEKTINNNEANNKLNINEIQIYQSKVINNDSITKKELSSNSNQINFQDLNLLNDKLASLLFNRTISSNNYYQQSFEKNNYGLTEKETIKFKKSMINLINQMNRDFSL